MSGFVISDLIVVVVEGQGFLSRKCWILVAGGVKVHNGQGEYPSQLLEFPWRPRDTIQVRQTYTASQRNTALGGDGAVGRKPRLERQRNRMY